MAWTPEAVFEACRDVVETPMELIKEYQFTLKDIVTTITIRLFRLFESDKVHFTQSHFIKTPTQVDEYVTSHPYSDDLGSALHQAVYGITQFYNEAVERGHSPSGEWLVPNKFFR
ncbi:MAG: hypothetical protein ABSC55_08500 [Syntrophorhabdales bacterium]|jgi:hypothetical protein